MRRLAVPLASVLLAACHATAPARVAAPAEDAPVAAQYPQAYAVLARGANAANTDEFLGKWLKGLGPWGKELPADYFWKGALRAFRQTFGRVEEAGSAADARARRPDVVAVVDMFSAELPGSVFGSAKVEYKAVLTRADGSAVMEATASADKKVTKETPFGMAYNRMRETVRMAADEASGTLAAELRASPALREALEKPSAAPAAPGLARAFRSDVETPAYRRGEDPTRFAVVVGVERYGGGVPPADHAARDAKTMKAHLLALGYPERNIALITDHQAGKAALEKYLEAWLPKQVGPDSTVFFYFSGHGAPDVTKGDAYLIPWDGDPKFLETTAYPVKRVYEKLNALKAKRVLVAMDACFSGVGGRSVIAKGLRPLVAKVDDGAAAAGRLSALTASASDEASGAHEEAGHGLFTYELLKALGASGGRATLRQLHESLTPRVRDAARRDNRDQTPQLLGKGEEAL